MMVCFFVGLFYLFQTKPTGFIPTEDEKRLYVTYEMPEGASTTRSIELMKNIQERIMAIPAVETVGGLAGLNILTFSNKSNAGTIFVTLKHWHKRNLKTESVPAIIGEIYKRTGDIKEARILAISLPAIPGLGQSSGFTFELQQTTSTDDIKAFEGVMRNFLNEVNKRPEDRHCLLILYQRVHQVTRWM